MMDITYELFFKVLSNKNRLRIVDLLRRGSKNVTQICLELELEQSLVSHNLGCLSNCGFVHARRNGKMKEYQLDEEAILPVLEFIDKHLERYGEKFSKCEVLRNERR